MMQATNTVQKFGVEVPTKIMTGTTRLNKFLCKKISINHPRARATATYFFQKAYDGMKETDPQIVYFIIASLHLATKVYDDGRHIHDFIEALNEARYDKDLVTSLPALSHFGNFDSEYRQLLTTKIINAQNDIIYRLDFKFRVPLPYQSATYFSKCIAHWHIPEEDSKKPNKNIDILSNQIENFAWAFLNDLQFSHLFYAYPPDIVGLIAVRLSCEILKLPLVSPKRLMWFSALLPFRDVSEMTEATQAIRPMFKQVINEHKPIEINIDDLEQKMKTFYIAPLEDYREIDEMCPPPPLELLEEFVGHEDSFNKVWWDHLPDIPPPPLELLASEVPQPVASISRRRSDDFEEEEQIFVPKEFGVKLPTEADLRNRADGAVRSCHHTPDHFSRSESRSELRSDYRGDYRSDYRSDYRGEMRSESRGELRGDLRSESRGDLRDDLRDDYLGPASRRRDPYDYRDPRDSRSVRDYRDSADIRDTYDYRDSRDGHAVRDIRESRDSRDIREIRDTEDPYSRDSKKRNFDIYDYREDYRSDYRDEYRGSDDRYNEGYSKPVYRQVEDYKSYRQLDERGSPYVKKAPSHYEQSDDNRFEDRRTDSSRRAQRSPEEYHSRDYYTPQKSPQDEYYGYRRSASREFKEKRADFYRDDERAYRNSSQERSGQPSHNAHRSHNPDSQKRRH
ncbi:hypothetical protein TRFO_34320 [Tritrichomonas foetus]|uniref:Uncharacterized protein n=1 Tax=Tritrichomonas foetus TaxID=1144522 RepID=A0A1J4JP43_9EUKA|nr:hypothetical protein TRFO_34320 [Tritrichomonas foetus]|eukprot:OHS99285.1 hypothetical protein TRFO_34320 [Tritrichomonas foetus]